MSRIEKWKILTFILVVLCLCYISQLKQNWKQYRDRLIIVVRVNSSDAVIIKYIIILYTIKNQRPLTDEP